jgi:hypothetical protein
MQHECNVSTFGELALCTRTEKEKCNSVYIQNPKNEDVERQLLNNVDVQNDLLDKRVLPSQPVLQQIRQVFTNGTSTMNIALETLNSTRIN